MAEKISQKVYGAVCLPFEAAGLVAAKSDGLEKVSKLVISVIDGLQAIFARYGNVAILASTVVLKGKLKIVADVISGLNLINRLYEWVCPESGKDVPFWLATTRTAKERFILNAKIISRVFLTAAHVIDFAKLMDAFGLISLGRVASQTVGRIPLINLAKDSLIVVSSVFSIIGGVATLTDVSPQWRRAGRRCQKWKEIGDALNSGGAATDRVALDQNAAKKAILENRLAGRCKEKAAFHAEQHAKLVDKLVEKGVDRALITALEDTQRAYSEGIVGEDNFEDRQGLKRARDDAASAITRLFPAKQPSSNWLVSSVTAGVNKAFQVVDNQTAVKKLVGDYQAHVDKEIKWNGCSAADATLDGGLEGYTGRKLDRAATLKRIEVDAKRANVLSLRDELTRDGKVGEDIQNQDARLIRALAALRSVEQELEVLETLGNNNQVTVFANHRIEVLKVNETNSCRKVTKTVIALAYDVMKIAIITFALTGLALGLATFSWTMVIFALALTVNGMGVFKFFYDELIAKKVEKAPKLTVAPAA